MKRKKNKFIKVLLIFISIILVLIVFRKYNNYRVKNNIIKLVNNNLAFLNASIENDDYEKIYEIEGVEDIREYPLADKEVYIEFFSKGYGIVSSSIYKGFYYVSDDKPRGFQGHSSKLVPEGKGWKWEQAGGDNWDYTEKIADHWYYYEAGF